MEETSSQPQVTSNVGFPSAASVPTNPQKKNWKWLVILVLFLLVIGGITFFVFKSSRSAATLEESPTPDTSTLTNVATPAPTATPVSSPADKSQINIQVLNGTGIAGEAGILADQLKNLGYSNVTTGNASTQNATDTQVTYGPKVGQDVISEIGAKLNDLYTNVTTSNSTLNGVDIQIITGLRKGQTAQPTDTPTPTATPAQ